jgi:hypothetical protein
MKQMPTRHGSTPEMLASQAPDSSRQDATGVSSKINDSLVEYYRCPKNLVQFALKGSLSGSNGYFRFGGETICYGHYCGHRPAALPTDALRDALADTECENGTVRLPFDPSQVADNLRRELYSGNWQPPNPPEALTRLYYLLRPALGVSVRKHLQRLHLKGWDKLPFPQWPVDCSVDTMFARLLLLCVKSSRAERIPFIWFWPQGAPSCAIMTHDVESESGRSFLPGLMDMDDSFGIKSSFQIVPEGRYAVSKEFLRGIRERGFEVVVHDLNHDGHLYRDREQFLRRAASINTYGKEYEAKGFRAGALYRKQLWYDALDFSYDMSVPNVAHLDPQRGGCCTVMPHFLGKILELPVTMTQDYTLFNILIDDSMDLWKRQIDIVMSNNGLMDFIVHPDYIVNSREKRLYETLLAHLSRLRQERGIWIATPGEVNDWWRQRSEMELIQKGGEWQIEGPGSERARIAWASEKEGRLVLAL